MGTPQYMAPEMTAGVADERSDVFMLGAALHEVVTGQPRHEGESALLVLCNAAHVEPYAYADSLPSELAAICNRACARSPEARFQTVTALRDAIMTFREHRAANQLSEQAEERLGQLLSLTQGPDAGEMGYAAAQRRFIETRFGFEAALEIWSASPQASRGLHRCVCTMIDFELSLRHVDAAAALLEGLREPDPRRQARVRSLRYALRLERSQLDQLTRDRDPRVGAAGRVRAYRLLGMSVLLMTLVLQRWLFAGASTTTLRLVLVGALVLALMLGVVAWWRRHAALNFINRRLAQISVATLAVSFANRLSGHLLDLPPERVLISDAFLLGLGGATMAAYHRAGPWLACTAFGVAIAGSIWPTWVDELFIGLTVFAATAALLLGRAGLATPDAVASDFPR